MKTSYLLLAALVLLMLGFSNNIIAQTITVSGAGTTDVNGTYTKQAYLYDGKPQYLKDPYKIVWFTAYSRWFINDFYAGTVYYMNWANTTNPPNGDWVVSNIYAPSPPPVSPAPTLTGDVDPLPVELTFFTAITKGRGVELVWKTVTEVNNYGFDIERKAIDNGQWTMDNWSTIGFVEGNGTTNAPKEYSFTEKNVSTGKYSYRLKQIDRDGKFSYLPEAEVSISAMPAVYALEQNYPNPFNPETQIGYSLPLSGFTTLKIYDALGREIETLVNGTKEAGNYTLQWNGAARSSGIYYYRLHSGTFTSVKKLLLLK